MIGHGKISRSLAVAIVTQIRGDRFIALGEMLGQDGHAAASAGMPMQAQDGHPLPLN